MNLNRRNFIGGVIAAASTPTYATGLPSTGTANSVAQAQWLKKGLIDAGGTHEPYIFVVRRGGQRLDARQTSAYEQSEELIRQLRDKGVEVFHTHLYKGFGMEAEREEMEETRKAAEIAHRYGMKVDTYIQWNSMMYETFFAEEPRAVNWIQRDISGLPILLTYGYQQSFRYRPCFANQDYLAYLKKIVNYAIVEVHTDFIHFDNFDLNGEPDSCHCPVCVAGFRKHLLTKYSAVQLRERFGFDRVNFVNPPQWNNSNPPEKMQIIFDPAFQEWIDFRCQLMADALQQMFEYATSLSSDVALEINPGGITGENRPWESGIDHARLLKFTRSFWSEEENAPRYHADGRLVSKIRSYKLARSYSNILLTPMNNSLDFAEALAFNQTLGFVGSNPISQEAQEYINFYRKNRERYEDSEDVANVAVLRSYASLTYNNAAAQLCAVLVEQALIQSCIPFDLVFDEGLRNLDKYKVLILPNSECLSEDQISLIRRHVDGGRGLVVIGQTGLYDEWRRVRITPGLDGLVDKQDLASDYQERVESQAGKAPTTARKLVGSGRVGYLSLVEIDGTVPPDNPSFAITNKFWKRPKNWKELTDLIHWAAEDQIPLLINGPDFLVANCTSQPRHRRLFVHLVNYNALQIAAVTAIRVSVALPEKHRATKVTAHSPEFDEARQLDLTHEGSRTAFTVPEVQTYALITIEW